MIVIQPVQVLTDLSQHRLNTCIVLNYATVSKIVMLREVNCQVYSVLKRPVQFCLIASLIAYVHGRCILCLKTHGWCNQLVTEQ